MAAYPLSLLHWLTALAFEADGTATLGRRGFCDDLLGNQFGQLADQCIYLRSHLLSTRCSEEQQHRFWHQRTTAQYHALPETFLLHHEELDQLRLKLTPPPPLYKVRLLGKAMEIFYDLVSFETTARFQCHDWELWDRGTEPLFAVYYASRNAIKGANLDAWDEIHNALDMAIAECRLKWQTRWHYFACLAGEVSDEQTASGLGDRQEESYSGDVAVELTGLAAMRQRWTLVLAEPLTSSGIAALAKETAGNHAWNYQGMQEDTIEVTMLSQPSHQDRKEEVDESITHTTDEERDNPRNDSASVGFSCPG